MNKDICIYDIIYRKLWRKSQNPKRYGEIKDSATIVQSLVIVVNILFEKSVPIGQMGAIFGTFIGCIHEFFYT
jgi:hypothetical protein